MPYIIKMRSTRGYISKIYKKDDNYGLSYHKHLNEAKVWKTEKGVRAALFKVIYHNDDINPEDFMIIKKTNSELGIYEPYKNDYKDDVVEEEPDIESLPKPKKKNIILIKLKQFLNCGFKYIKEQIKFYFPE